ncbi:MAG TPA: hypothetical protein P5562_02605 [Candidatus Woesebacteria bacterium]|nr:hypothetical protein [Candidatus Woesebacteria bacterium]
MAVNPEEVSKLINKVKSLEKGHRLDLSSGEDLSVAIMNLIGIEEHMFFTAQKTGQVEYLTVLQQAREMRKELMKKIVKDNKGEVWCTSKHLLAASMRLMEVGTKCLTQKKKKEAQDYFQKSFILYNLFWGLNLGLVKDGSQALKIEIDKSPAEQPLPKKDLLGNISRIIGKILNCCRE